MASLSDNYIWLIHRNGHAAVVDPGEAAPARRVLQALELTLDDILLSYHHRDHVGGVRALQAETSARLSGPTTETLPSCDRNMTNRTRTRLCCSIYTAHRYHCSTC